MMNHTALIQQLFGKSSLTEVSGEQLEALVSQYPYFAPLHWLGALKGSESNIDQSAVHKAAAYAYYPFRLRSYFFQEDLTENTNQEVNPTPSAEAPASEDTMKGMEEGSEKTDLQSDSSAPSAEESQTEPLIQPLFTQDYFAYTGTRIPEHMAVDKPPTLEQLHSFTDWLRTLNRPKGTLDPDLSEDQASLAAQAENEDSHLKKTAEDSLRQSEEVLTEAMAEVRGRMGQREKAIEIYQKLSLSNPEKSSYFAQKIADLKSK
jgi:hypothetical protein